MLTSQNKQLNMGNSFKSRWVQFSLLATAVFCAYDFSARLLPSMVADKNSMAAGALAKASVRQPPYDSSVLLASWPLDNSQQQAATDDGQSDSASAALFNSNGIKLRLMAVYAVPEQADKIHALLSYQTLDSQPQLLLLSPGQQVGPFTLQQVALNEATFVGTDQTFTLYLFKALTREENHS